MESNQAEKQEGYGYTPDQARKITDQMLELRDAQPGIQLDLAHLAEQLTVPRAKTFATEALGRRLPIVERTVLNVFRIYPPDRSTFIQKDESADIAIQLHAFAINVYALFDNIAWICALEEKLDLNPMDIGLYKHKCQAVITDVNRYCTGLTTGFLQITCSSRSRIKIKISHDHMMPQAS